MHVRALLAVAGLLLTGCASDDSPVLLGELGTVAAPAREPSYAPAPSPEPVVVERGDGQLHLVPAGGPTIGSGQLLRWSVKVEGGLGVDAERFAAEVERTLTDPRSWGSRYALRRVDDGSVDFRVVLASPRTTDRLCAPLDTGGQLSCANGEAAVVNVRRWLTGASTYAGRLPDYRQYVVNHEVGHALGHRHDDCPVPGAPAPVMVQQTLGLQGCRANAWPYP